jgi:hypothetical protein
MLYEARRGNLRRVSPGDASSSSVVMAVPIAPVHDEGDVP